MSNRRDRLIAVTAALMVLLLAGSVVLAILTAERNGRKALQNLQLAQLNQLARLLDGSIAPALSSASGLTNPTTGQPWHLLARDATDAAGLAALQARLPADSRAGYVLVNKDSIIVGGTLLTDPASIGRSLQRTGLSTVLQGKAALLPVNPHSLTTPLPTMAIARPLTAGAHGAVTGAILLESDVAADSAFDKIMVGFRRAKTDEYSFLDSAGIVIASTNPATVGQRADAMLLDPRVGFHSHGAAVTATATIPSAGWTAVYRQRTREFEGNLTGPIHSALLLLIGIALFGAGLTSFTLLSRLRASRREQQRLASINDAREEFISIVSHELRTPATGQLGFLQTLLDHWDGMTDLARQQTVMQAYANARRLHALTRDVLDTTSIEAGELPYTFEVMDLRPALQIAADAIPHGDIHVVVAATREPILVRADPERIQQVLTNLLDNAMKSSPGGTTVEVRVEATEDHEALVEVSDRGAGVDAADAERAFDKFSRGRNPTTRGTGLGLFICRKILDAHNGRIWIGPRAGGGATVSFTLPLAAAAAHRPDAVATR
jgi:signal transduction histidine kinase